jgi:hypothetical protein
MILKFLSKIALLADNQPSFLEKLKYFGLVISTLAPIVWLTEVISGWYIENQRGASFIIFCIIANLFIGAWFHHKMRTFSWEQLIKKNTLIVSVLVPSYIMLEMLRITAGENLAADSFRIIIQLSSLIYPISKSLKNLYILSNKQFPPAFIMERLYNFEKTGNLKDLFPDEPKTE